MRQFLAWLAVCGVCGLLVTATVTVVSVRGARVTERWVADGRRTVATIVGRNEQSVNVNVIDADGSGLRLMAAPVDYPDDYDPGQKYPAVVRDDGNPVRLLAEPYDALEPILWAAIPTAVNLGRPCGACSVSEATSEAAGPDYNSSAARLATSLRSQAVSVTWPKHGWSVKALVSTARALFDSPR